MATDKPEEILVILLSNIALDPDAIVVETGDALVRDARMFGPGRPGSAKLYFTVLQVLQIESLANMRSSAA